MKRVLVIAVVIAAVAGTAEAAIINFAFPIDGGQVVPPVATPASGTGTVTLDTATNLLSWNITFAGFSPSYPETAAHFHGPALPGANAGIQLGLGVGSPKIGNAVITATQAIDVQNHLWYVNIHSTLYPAGQIRGQVVPEPASLVLLCVGGLALLKRRPNR
jgi:hypothetical protein